MIYAVGMMYTAQKLLQLTGLTWGANIIGDLHTSGDEHTGARGGHQAGSIPVQGAPHTTGCDNPVCGGLRMCGVCGEMCEIFHAGRLTTCSLASMNCTSFQHHLHLAALTCQSHHPTHHCTQPPLPHPPTPSTEPEPTCSRGFQAAPGMEVSAAVPGFTLGFQRA